jgi:hypothetical protein
MPIKFTTRNTPKVMFANCGDNQYRSLNDCAKYSFISAGQGYELGQQAYYFSNQIRRLIIGDIIAVYRNEVGYVGIARVISMPTPLTQATFNDAIATPNLFERNMFNQANNPEYEECIVKIKWLTPIHLSSAPQSGRCFGIFAKPLVVCSLDKQIELKNCLQVAFNVNFNDLLNG